MGWPKGVSWIWEGTLGYCVGSILGCLDFDLEEKIHIPS